MIIMFDFVPELVKKSISRSGDWRFLLVCLSKKSGIVQIFSFGDDILVVVFL